jgi:hypothetical protein
LPEDGRQEPLDPIAEARGLRLAVARDVERADVVLADSG